MPVADELVDQAEPVPYAELLALVEKLRADNARWRAASAPHVWLPLKQAAYDAGVPYETARAWAAAERFESYKQGGRVIANVTSLIACRVRLTGR
jgi:hypothetical protein